MALTLAGDGKDGRSSSNITESGLEGALYSMLDTETDGKLTSDVQDTLVSLLQALAIPNLTRWLQLLKDVLSASSIGGWCFFSFCSNFSLGVGGGCVEDALSSSSIGGWCFFSFCSNFSLGVGGGCVEDALSSSSIGGWCFFSFCSNFSLGVGGGCVEDVLCATSIGGGWFFSVSL